MVRKIVAAVLEKPVKALFLFIFIVPLLWMISVSLQTFREMMAYPPALLPSSLQFINYIKAMRGGPFLTYGINSIVITLSIILIQFCVMVPAAYAFAKYTFPFKRVLFGIVLLALMIPGQVTFIPLYLLMSKWGLIDTLLPQILPFMTNAFGIFLLRQYFMQVPEEVIDSARVDGASEFWVILRVMIPMSVPALATVTLFSFVAHWNDYFWPLVMTNDTNVRTLPLGIKMLQETEGVTQWHVVMAGNVILVLPILIVYILCAKQILRAFIGTGIK
ncbi:MAG: carbohydrate ABC transporter permease [Ethanoligenens sp.]|uniref:carbohydrate ABC transporter permease n=1 Tax=Ethanoligenens sp. TaxID=2099655 RepID=UPI0039E7FD7F